ncbi:MAG: hypothetical protein ACRECO_16705 [Xanthobacteraceae bacterium]
MNLAARIAILSLLLVAPAQAQDTAKPQDPGNQRNIEIATNLICDTPQQVERFVALFDGNAELAISTVNDEAQTPNACVVATAAYVKGEERATARSQAGTFQAGTFQVFQIFVVGVVTLNGMQAVQPAEFFTLMPVEEQSVTVGRRPQ